VEAIRAGGSPEDEGVAVTVSPASFGSTGGNLGKTGLKHMPRTCQMTWQSSRPQGSQFKDLAQSHVKAPREVVGLHHHWGSWGAHRGTMAVVVSREALYG
jgi:hypothetical protein